MRWGPMRYDRTIPAMRMPARRRALLAGALIATVAALAAPCWLIYRPMQHAIAQRAAGQPFCLVQGAGPPHAAPSALSTVFMLRQALIRHPQPYAILVTPHGSYIWSFRRRAFVPGGTLNFGFCTASFP